jgi:hypothetical protein
MIKARVAIWDVDARGAAQMKDEPVQVAETSTIKPVPRKAQKALFVVAGAVVGVTVIFRPPDRGSKAGETEMEGQTAVLPGQVPPGRVAVASHKRRELHQEHFGRAEFSQTLQLVPAEQSYTVIENGFVWGMGPAQISTVTDGTDNLTEGSMQVAAVWERGATAVLFANEEPFANFQMQRKELASTEFAALMTRAIEAPLSAL